MQVLILAQLNFYQLVCMVNKPILVNTLLHSVTNTIVRVNSSFNSLPKWQNPFLITWICFNRVNLREFTNHMYLK